MTDSTSHPDVIVMFVVSLAEPPSMADDRLVAANGTSPRQEIQWDYPRLMLSFASGSVIKIIWLPRSRQSLSPFDLPAVGVPCGEPHPLEQLERLERNFHKGGGPQELAREEGEVELSGRARPGPESNKGCSRNGG
jgi:hypothetical protein